MNRLLLEDVDGAALTTRQEYLPPGRPYYEEPQYYYYASDAEPQTHHNRGVVDWCWRILVTSLKLIGLGILSMGSYAVFYQIHQPRVLHFQTFHFDYYQQPIPSATCRLQSKPYQWTPLLDDVESLSSPEPRILQPRQAYYVELTLKLPESQRNLDSGMFGIVTELYGASNETTRLLATSRRSLRFPYRSPWVRAMANLVTLPSLLLHVMEEVQTVKDCVFRYVVESEVYALHTVQLRLLEPIEVLAAELRVGAELTPFQELIQTWFWTCFLVGSSLFAMFYLCVYQLWQRWLARREEEPPCDLNFDEFSVPDASIGIDGAEDPNSTTFADSQQRQEAQNRDSETTQARPRRTTHVPTEEVHVPDAFADGNDDDWEDLTVAGNEGQAIISEASRQGGRSMTNNDLRHYLSREDESNQVHPFLVFMDD